MSKTSNFFWSAILAVFLFLPSSVMGQVWFGVHFVSMTNRGSYYENTSTGANNAARVEDGGELRNKDGGTIFLATVNGGELWNGQYYNGGGGGRITNATVNGGGLYNLYDGTIGTATVNGGELYNWYGTITDATINYGGELYSGGEVTNATVNEGGWLNNEAGTITNATVKGGSISNQLSGKIDTVTVTDDGYLGNHMGTISTATVTDGTLYNDDGRITTITITGGMLLNNSTVHSDWWNIYGWIGNVTQNGGTINNQALIDEMTYVSGTYNNGIAFWEGRDIGIIGTLTLAGNSALNTGNWGNIENLVFDKDGNGVATLTAFDDGNGFGFNGIKADYVDFSNGNISLDMTGFGGISELYGGFYLSTLFGATGFGGVANLSSLGVTWGTDSFWILNGGVWGAGWSIDSVTGFVSYEVPEPATLLMLGLAAAGIPVVRRWRRE